MLLSSPVHGYPFGADFKGFGALTRKDVSLPDRIKESDLSEPLRRRRLTNSKKRAPLASSWRGEERQRRERGRWRVRAFWPQVGRHSLPLGRREDRRGNFVKSPPKADRPRWCWKRRSIPTRRRRQFLDFPAWHLRRNHPCAYAHRWTQYGRRERRHRRRRAGLQISLRASQRNIENVPIYSP